jgi:hypothetical protein
MTVHISCPYCSFEKIELHNIKSLNDVDQDVACMKCGTIFHYPYDFTDKTVRGNILQEADKLTASDRRKEYGHPKENFRHIADMWQTILQVRITSEQVIDCMIALKLCRAKQGYKRDTYVDIAGYARCAELIQENGFE